MRIALVHDWLTGMRGGEKCLEPVCKAFPQAPLYTLLHRRGSVSPAIEQRTIVTSFLQRVPGIGRSYRYWLPAMPRAIESLRLPRDLELVLSFSHAVAKSVRVPEGVPHVSYCFTPMRYAWGRRSDYFPAAATAAGNTWAHWCQQPLATARNLVLDQLQQWDRRTSHRVTYFLTSSKTVASRLLSAYGRDSHVIHPPVDTQFYTPVEVPRESYYLCLSALVPYKRLDLAIEACNHLRRPLVIIGQGPERARLQALAGPTVEFLGWRSNAEIRDHLRRCRALLFPGHEDFGIVPLEAQACGATVIALGQGGATETVRPCLGDEPGSGLFFHSADVDSLCQAIRYFEQNPAEFCPQVARQQALGFSTDRYERQLLKFLKQVAAGQSPTAPAAVD